MEDYWIGVIFAILGGSISSLGVILQKGVVNEIHTKSKEKPFFRSLVKKPMWLLGLILGTFAPAIFIILAQLYVGPALVPGLMSAGLIVLAIGSVKINKERLERPDYVGIILMMFAIIFFSGSMLSVPMEDADLNSQWLFTNSVIFGVILFALWGFFAVIQKGSRSYRAVLLIMAAGMMFAQQNYWMAPLSGTISKAFGGVTTTNEFTFFLVSCVFLIAATPLAIAAQQTAYKYGQASTLNTLQQFPVQIAPPFVYLLVFQFTPTYDWQLPLLLIGIALVLTSSYLLARRKVEISKIK